MAVNFWALVELNHHTDKITKISTLNSQDRQLNACTFIKKEHPISSSIFLTVILNTNSFMIFTDGKGIGTYKLTDS